MTSLVIVFDLDQTMGYFTQVGILIDSIETILNRKMKLNEIFELFNLFPQIFRKGMMKTFAYLKTKKQNGGSILKSIIAPLGTNSFVATGVLLVMKKLLLDKDISKVKSS